MYSSVVTKQSICHEGTVKHKECSAHKTGFVHNMWSGMLIIAGSEKERVQVRLSPLISHLYTPGKQRRGQRSKPQVSASSRIHLIGSPRPRSQNPSLLTPCYISLQPLLLICLTLIILAFDPLFSWHTGIERMVNCSLHKSN